MSREEEPFLSRWSRRKLQPEPEEEADLPVEAASDIEEEPPGDEAMPPLESLDETSDYSLFLSPGVSESLRRLALRKLFHSPAFNVVDGLDDYDDDFSSFAKLGSLVTEEMRRRAGEMLQENGAKLAGNPAPSTAETLQADGEADDDDDEPMDEEVG